MTMLLTFLLVLILIPMFCAWIVRVILKHRARRIEREAEQREQEEADRKRMERLKKEFKRSGKDTPFEEI